jgi:hypothetical protein
VLQRLPILSLHAPAYPSKMTISLHRQDPSHVIVSMLTGISRAGGKAIMKVSPMNTQVFRQPFNLLNQQPPSIWIKNVFLGVFIPQFLPLSH